MCSGRNGTRSSRSRSGIESSDREPINDQDQPHNPWPHSKRSRPSKAIRRATPMTEPDAQRLLAVLATAFPDDQQLVATQKLYRRMMRDLDANACTQAIARLIATSKKLPKIAEIRSATMAQLQGRREFGLEAWGRVQKAVAREGIRKRPGDNTERRPGDFHFAGDDGPIILRCVDAMGWEYLCCSENQVADRARFIELYEQLATGAIEDRNVGEIAAPIPRRQLHVEARHIAAIVGEVVPKES